jgi:hypothetical protein
MTTFNNPYKKRKPNENDPPPPVPRPQENAALVPSWLG